MKKNICFVVGMTAMLCGLVGCSQAYPVSQPVSQHTAQTTTTPNTNTPNVEPVKEQPLNNEQSISYSSNLISIEKAQEIALQHAGVSKDNTTMLKQKIDDGKYEFEFFADTVKYEYEINMQSGAIYKSEQEHMIASSSNQANTTSNAFISTAEAKALAQAKAPNATLSSFKLDFDDGIAQYEGELYEGFTEYSFEIDAVTGAFMKWEVDID